MAAPDYKPIFKVKYNPVRGLASLLTGMGNAKQQAFQNNNVDRNAPIGVNEAARAQMEQKAKMQALMEAMNPGGGMQSLLSSYPSAQPAVAPQGYNVDTGAPNQGGPGIQGLSSNISPVVQSPLPVGQPTPTAPTAVNKAGAIFGSARNQLKAMYAAAKSKGAVSFDDATNTFYDAKGNPVE
jgi:hypothetical protein